MRQGSENFFCPPQFFQIFADFSPSNCSSSKTVPSFSFLFFFPKSQDPYVLPGQKIVKKAYFWIFIFFDEFSGLYTDLRPRMGCLVHVAIKSKSSHPSIIIHFICCNFQYSILLIRVLILTILQEMKMIR